MDKLYDLSKDDLIRIIKTQDENRELEVSQRINTIKKKYLALKKHVDKLNESIKEKNKVIDELAKTKGIYAGKSKNGRYKIKRSIIDKQR